MTTGYADMQSQSREFVAPLGQASSGCLVFASGANRVNLKTVRMMPDLYRARFTGHVPGVWLRKDTLTIQYPRFPFLHWPVSLHGPFAEIFLNGSIPWEIEFRSGVSEIQASLSGLQLRSLDILGGASRLELLLSQPAETAYIYVSGGISQGIIWRPTGVGVRVRISGGVSKLAFDGQRFGALGGETSLESPNFNRSMGRYEICIGGGASNLTIKEQE